MDTLTPMGRRYVGPPSSVGVGGGGGDYHDYHDHHNHPPPPPMQHYQPGQFWYPPPPSSAPSGEPQFPPPHHHLQQQPQPQHPLPPMASGPFHPLPPPHYPHHQPRPPPPWAPPPDHLQQPYQPSNFPPSVPLPLGIHPGVPSSAAAGSPHRHGVPPPNPPYPGARPVYPPPAHPHAPHAPPPPPHLPPATLPHSYSQPSQTWENPSWHATLGWDYTDTKIHYNNEEDWAARARAWADANSATESLPMQPHYMPSGMPNIVYHDQHQLDSGPPFTDSQHSSLSTQDQQFADSSTDLHRRVNSSQESSLNSMSYSVTNFPTYDARNEGLATETSVTPSLPQRNFSSSTSVNVQEVPSSYSSFSGNKESVDQFEKLSIPSHSSPVMSVPGRLPTSAVNSVSREQSHLPYRDQSIEYFGTGDRSQAIEKIPFDRGQAQNASSANVDQGRSIDLGLPSSSVHGWAQSIAPGPVFPHITPVPPGSQFDSLSISSSLPGHPVQVFGRIQGPNFQPSIQPVSVPFGFDAGSSLHPASVFPLDANEAFNLSERPKKAAVPNWLRDEIIKKKVALTSSAHEHPNGGSHSTVAEVHDKISRKDELADSKSVDSMRSTEDDDDEDDMDAARSAAINQEIKRVLTDVLLKVTDELFEEIAAKVLNEDEREVEHSAVVAECKGSMSPPQSMTLKSSAIVIVPAATTSGKSGALGHSLLGSSGGDVLGLANYASDDDSEETPGSRMPFYGKVHDSSDQKGTRDATSEHTLKKEKVSMEVAAEEPGDGRLDVESVKRNNVGFNGVLTHKNRLEVAKSGMAVGSLESGSVVDQKVAVREKTELESEAAHGDSDNRKSKGSQVTEFLSKSGPSDVPHDKKGSLGRNFTEEAESVAAKGVREDAGSGNLKKQANRDLKPEKTDEKTDERATLKRRSKDLSSKQASDVRASESRRAMYHNNDMDDKKGSGRHKKDRMKEDDHWKRERTRGEKKDRSKDVMRDSHRPKSRQTSSPSARGRNGRDSPLGILSDDSGEEISETSKYRQVLRSPHSKHAQLRHFPYSHTDTRRRRRSRSSSPAHRKRSGHDR